MLSRSGWLEMGAWVAGIRRSGPTRTPRGDPPGIGVEVAPSLRLRQQPTGVLSETRWRVCGLWDTSHPDWTTGHGADFALMPLDLSAWVNLPLRIEQRLRPTGLRPNARIARLHQAMEEAGLSVAPTFHDTVILGILDQISGYGSPEAA